MCDTLYSYLFWYSTVLWWYKDYDRPTEEKNPVAFITFGKSPLYYLSDEITTSGACSLARSTGSQILLEMCEAFRPSQQGMLLIRWLDCLLHSGIQTSIVWTEFESVKRAHLWCINHSLRERRCGSWLAWCHSSRVQPLPFRAACGTQSFVDRQAAKTVLLSRIHPREFISTSHQW